MICDHCGLTVQGFGTVSLSPFGPEAAGVTRRVAKLCHTNAIGRPDCYRRVTTYHEPLGVLKNVLPLPNGIEDIVDPGLQSVRTWDEVAETLRAMFPDATVVCITHKRFIPCRKTDGTCIFSSAEIDVTKVREYQTGK